MRLCISSENDVSRDRCSSTRVAHDEGAFAGLAVDQAFAHQVVDRAPHGRTAQVIVAHQIVLGRERIAGFVDALGNFFPQSLGQPVIERRMTQGRHGARSKPCILAIVHYLLVYFITIWRMLSIPIFSGIKADIIRHTHLQESDDDAKYHRQMMKRLRQDAVATMSRYVQFDTTNPPGNELPAAEWLRDQIIQRGITPRRDRSRAWPQVAGWCWRAFPAAEPLKPLMINHHIDVVAADPAQWTHPPFSGAIADGFVWGRGTLDTKGLGVMFLLALESLLKEGVRFRRPIVMTAVPDEEAGGSGMKWLVENHAAAIDPEWVWDEGSGGLKGMFGSGIMFAVAVAEKTVQWLKLIATGDPGHGSMPHNNNANVTLVNALKRITDSPRPMRVNATAAAMFKVDCRDAEISRIACAAQSLQPFALMRWRPSGLTRDKPHQRAGARHDQPEHAQRRLQGQRHPGKGRGEPRCPPAARNRSGRIRPLAQGAHQRRPRQNREHPDSRRLRASRRWTTRSIEAVTHAVNRHVPGAGVFPLLMSGATDGRYWRMRGYPAYGFGPCILERARRWPRARH